MRARVGQGHRFRGLCQALLLSMSLSRSSIAQREHITLYKKPRPQVLGSVSLDHQYRGLWHRLRGSIAHVLGLTCSDSLARRRPWQTVVKQASKHASNQASKSTLLFAPIEARATWPNTARRTRPTEHGPRRVEGRGPRHDPAPAASSCGSCGRTCRKPVARITPDVAKASANNSGASDARLTY